MSEQLVFVGIFLVFLGILLIVVGSISGVEKGKIEFGFGGFIGPIPFGWASDPRMLKWVILFSLAVLIIFLILVFTNYSKMI